MKTKAVVAELLKGLQKPKQDKPGFLRDRETPVLSGCWCVRWALLSRWRNKSSQDGTLTEVTPGTFILTNYCLDPKS